MRGAGVELYLAEVRSSVLDTARASGLLEALGEERVFPTLELAVEHVRDHGRTTQRKPRCPVEESIGSPCRAAGR